MEPLALDGSAASGSRRNDAGRELQWSDAMDANRSPAKEEEASAVQQGTAHRTVHSRFRSSRNASLRRSAGCPPHGRVQGMQPGEVLADIIAGSAVAVVVAAIAWFVTGRFAQRQEAAKARHQRLLAAAEELYGVYGQFFATWKAWEFARGRRRDQTSTVADEVRLPLLTQAAQVEGRYESVIVRVALEHHLDLPERTAMWSLRFALKELRSAIRDDSPLGWWRTDDPASPQEHAGALRYAAFKDVTAKVASILVDADTSSPLPTVADRSAALAAITATLSPEGPSRQPRLKRHQWHQVSTTQTEALNR